MEREQFINGVKSECQFLEQEGYAFNQVETNIFYTKNTTDEGYRISFSWVEYGDNFHVMGLIAKKRFNIVERHLQKISGGVLEDYYTIYINPSSGHIPAELRFEITENNIRFILSDENEIRLFGFFAREFYKTKVVEFYSNFSDLSKVDERLEELLETKKIQTLFTSDNNAAILKFYLVSFIFDNKKILDFFDKTYFPYLNDNLSNEINKIELERFNKILKNW